MKKDKKTDTETLGGRLKGYEAEYETAIDPSKHIIIRIDGHKFSKYTKGFLKPFDDILSAAMVETTKDLVERFDAYTGYTQSDEITLFLPSLKDVTVDNREKKTHKLHKRVRDDWSHSFGGRVQKLASLVAAFATMSFNKHLLSLLEDLRVIPWEDNVDYIRTIEQKVSNAYFDARVYGVPDNDEVFNSFMWRCRDAEKNSRSMFAQAYCSHKELQGKTGPEQVEYCKNKTGKDWELVDDKYKYGTFVKKGQYLKETDTTVVHDRGQHGPTLRTKLFVFPYKLTSYSKENVELTVSQYIPKSIRKEIKWD